MVWQYRTHLFEFTKDGLLGDKYVDDEEMEKSLNELGKKRWELVNVSLLQDGLLVFLKRPVLDETVEELEQPVELEDVLSPPIVQPRPSLLTKEPAVFEPAPVVDEEEDMPQEEEREPEPESLPVRNLHHKNTEKDSGLDFVGGIRIS